MTLLRALLCDIDGTLTSQQGHPLLGAAPALRRIRDLGIRLRLLSNITAQSPATIADGLTRLGIQVEAEEVMTATTSCARYLDTRPGLRFHLFVPAAVRPAFDRCVVDDVQPDAVVLGDIGAAFDYATLNRAFNMLRGGSELIALQRNQFWFDAAGARLDVGAFVAALETATGRRATITGKPASQFFLQALDDLGVRSEEALAVGDDLATDIEGAAGIGARHVLVRSGKGGLLAAGDISTTLPQLAGIADLLQWIERHLHNTSHASASQ